MDDPVIGVDDNLTAQEVATVRKASGWDGDLDEWGKCLEQNLVNVSARSAQGEVVGVGFLTGNIRHAEVTDLVVLPKYRGNHIASEILECILEAAAGLNIKYLSLTYDKNSPWLKDFYEKHDFKVIDFAMWHKSSLNT